MKDLMYFLVDFLGVLQRFRWAIIPILHLFLWIGIAATRERNCKGQHFLSVGYLEEPVMTSRNESISYLCQSGNLGKIRHLYFFIYHKSRLFMLFVILIKVFFFVILITMDFGTSFLVTVYRHKFFGGNKKKKKKFKHKCSMAFFPHWLLG